MNKTLKKVLLYVGKVMLATVVWCVLDYFTSDTLNIVENLIDVAIIVLLCNIIDCVVKKFKNNKKKK